MKNKETEEYIEQLEEYIEQLELENLDYLEIINMYERLVATTHAESLNIERECIKNE